MTSIVIRKVIRWGDEEKGGSHALILPKGWIRFQKYPRKVKIIVDNILVVTSADMNMKELIHQLNILGERLKWHAGKP